MLDKVQFADDLIELKNVVWWQRELVRSKGRYKTKYHGKIIISSFKLNTQEIDATDMSARRVIRNSQTKLDKGDESYSKYEKIIKDFQKSY